MLLTRAPLYSPPCGGFRARLACVRHAASVDSEPGSNSRLKPDACRRAEGRRNQPSALSRQPSARTKGNGQNRGGSPLSRSRAALARRAGQRRGVAHLVRSFGLAPEFISHDWHVQPSCQRPNRGPPGRRAFSPGGDTQVRLRLSSKPYKHTVRRKSRQRSCPTGFPDDFHIGNCLGQESCTRNQDPSLGSG